MLKLQWPKQTIFLADAFQIPSYWTRWNHETGYLGASAWILLANWILYVGVLRTEINWFFIVIGLLLIAMTREQVLGEIFWETAWWSQLPETRR